MLINTGPFQQYGRYAGNLHSPVSYQGCLRLCSENGVGVGEPVRVERVSCWAMSGDDCGSMPWPHGWALSHATVAQDAGVTRRPGTLCLLLCLVDRAMQNLTNRYSGFYAAVIVVSVFRQNFILTIHDRSATFNYCGVGFIPLCS